MPSKRISFSNFQRRLQLSGGREQTGPAALRRASGISAEVTPSIWSRWGSNLLYPSIDAIQLYYWNDARYAYDGAILYRNGVSIRSGFNGGKLSFDSLPPQPGLPDYLFILGGGITPFKIDPSGNITNWGIVAPPNQVQANNNLPDQIVIDTLVSAASRWANNGNCAAANDAVEYIVGAGSLKITPSTNPPNPGPWRAVNSTLIPGTPSQNLGTYSNGDISLQTDVIQFWLWIESTTNNQGWIEIDFDIGDGTFKHNYYSFSIGLLSSNSSNPNVTVHRATDETLTFQPQQWQQITIAKSQFTRVGLRYDLDWSSVQAVRFQGAYFDKFILLDNLTLSGGTALGAGPAVGNGGSEYDYFIVYRNTTTGSQSNPQPVASRVFNAQDNTVTLSDFPTSPDPQVDAIDIYRSQAGGGIAFYLDTIYDLTQPVTYVDSYSDVSYRLTTTPWQASVTVPPNLGAPYYIDAGNGYYFKATTAAGTPPIAQFTSGTTAPTWQVPTADWVAQGDFALADTVAPHQAQGYFFEVTTAGISGLTRPNWASALTPGNTVTDGTVIWTNTGLMTVKDGTAGVYWTFEGINSTPTLGNIAVLLDNAAPQSTYGWAFGPYESEMFWTMDSAAGRQGYIYASPPGRPESVAQAYQVTGSDDPMQAVLEFDGVLWALSEKQAFQTSVGAAYPSYRFLPLEGAQGTTQPWTVLRVASIGIVYWAHDGIRMLNFGGSRLFGYASLAPIFRGQTEEDVPAWSYLNPPTWAARIKDEILFSDGTTLTLALAYDGMPEESLDWRIPGPIMTAAHYDAQTGEVQACWGGNIYQFEVPGALTDNSAPIPFEIQSPGDMPDVGADFTTQYLWLTFTAAIGETVTPTLILDGAEFVLPKLTGQGKRVTYEMKPSLPARFWDGVRLNASLTGRIEVFRLEGQVYLGEQQMAQGAA